MALALAMAEKFQADTDFVWTSTFGITANACQNSPVCNSFVQLFGFIFRQKIIFNQFKLPDFSSWRAFARQIF